jgi:hypothetical protein
MFHRNRYRRNLFGLRRIFFHGAILGLPPFNHHRPFSILQRPNTLATWGFHPALSSESHHRTALLTSLRHTFSDIPLRQKVLLHSAFTIDSVGPRHRYQKGPSFLSFGQRTRVDCRAGLHQHERHELYSTIARWSGRIGDHDSTILFSLDGSS